MNFFRKQCAGLLQVTWIGLILIGAPRSGFAAKETRSFKQIVMHQGSKACIATTKRSDPDFVASVAEWDTLPAHVRVNSAFFPRSKGRKTVLLSFSGDSLFDSLPSDLRSKIISLSTSFRDQIEPVNSKYFPLIGKPVLSRVEIASTPFGEVLGYEFRYKQFGGDVGHEMEARFETATQAQLAGVKLNTDVEWSTSIFLNYDGTTIFPVADLEWSWSGH